MTTTGENSSAAEIFTPLEHLSAAEAAAQETCDRLEAVQISDDPRTLVFALDLCRRVKRSIGDLERDFVRGIADSSDERKFEVEHLGVVQIRTSKRRTNWDHVAIRNEFIRAYRDEQGVPRDSQGLLAFYERLQECVSIGGAKSAFAEFTGIELDEVCDEEPQAPSVQITTPDSAPRLEGR